MSDSEVDMSTNGFYDDISSSEDSNSNNYNGGKQAQEEEVTQPCVIQNNEKPKDNGCRRRPRREKKAIPDEAQQYIGILICKEYNGVRYLGTVRSYDVDTKWFRVEFYDGGSEDMRAGDVMKCIASNEQVSEALGINFNDTAATDAGKQKKPASGEGTSTRRTKKSRRNQAPYVPLAYRETKKDAYYYY